MVFFALVVIELPKVVETLESKNINVPEPITDIAQSNLYGYKKQEKKIFDSLKGTDSAEYIEEPAEELDHEETTSPLVVEPAIPIEVDDIQVNEPDQGEVIAAQTLQAPLTFLIVGDSLINQGTGPRLESDLFKYKGISVKRVGKSSTGLNRRDYFNWQTYTKTLINKYHPDVMVIMFGANDGQTIVDDKGRKYAFSDSRWDGVYRKRVNDYMKLISSKSKKVYWLGHPIPRTADFHKKFVRMNKIFKEESAKFPNIVYVDSWNRFAKNGKFAPIVADDNGLKGAVKHPDGVHFTSHGAKIHSQLIFKYLKKDIVLKPK